MIKRANKHAEIRCVPHAIAYHQEAVRQLARHSGPVWDRWRVANLVAAQRVLSSPAPGECPLGRR
ncbi:MAG TPA: hypothetical protein VGS19_04410 [Streptosporangiaceae bacterium]|nr:hypothetical protein [Streptosporangiaceae bacterium]